MHVLSKFRRLISFHQDLNVSFLRKWRLFHGNNSGFYTLYVVFLACLERPPRIFSTNLVKRCFRSKWDVHFCGSSKSVTKEVK